MYDYWQQQTTKSLFPDIEWSRPEQKNLAGRLGIVGGNKLSLLGVVTAYDTAVTSGVGSVRVLLPDVLKKQIPPAITDTIFAASTPSGSLAKAAIDELKALSQWAKSILLIGDAGRNSETAVVYEQLIDSLAEQTQLVISRDAIDLTIEHAQVLVERTNTILVMSLAQAQKLFRKVYYPKVLTFSMALAQLVEALHKFTITYSVCLVVFHDGFLIVAADGKVTTTPLANPMQIWRGETATRIASYYLWSPTKPLESATVAILTKI